MKRIPCRVVRSVPLARRDDASQSRRCGSERWADGSVASAPVGFEAPCNSNGYTSRAEGVRSGFGASAVGLVLDCLA